MRLALTQTRLLIAWLTLAAALSGYCQTEPPNAPSTPGAYDRVMTQARAFLNQKKPAEAKAKAEEAAKLDPNRYEAYAVLTLVAIRQDDITAARAALVKASELAPPEKEASLEALRKKLAHDESDHDTQPAKPTDKLGGSAPVTMLSSEARRKHDALLLILEDSDKAASPEERRRLLREFLAKSAEFLTMAPTQTNIWLTCGTATVELDYPGAGWLVGRHLKELGLEDSDDPRARKVMASLDRKGWLGTQRRSREWNKWQSVDKVKAAALDGDVEAQVAIGNAYVFAQWGLTRNFDEGLKWYQKAAEQNDARGQAMLGQMYEAAWGVEKNYAEAIRWFQKSAAQGDAFGQFKVGLMYEGGCTVERDYNYAVRWYQLSAEGGEVLGQAKLGLMYENGWGVGKDYTQAVKWYRKSAEQGNPIAQLRLGQMYQNGWGVEKNQVEAVKSYRQSAEQGNGDGQFKLGLMYENGWGVDKDISEAVMWYRKSAAQDDSYGQVALGSMYVEGLGVGKDQAEAVRWFRKSADQGNGYGQFKLGGMFENGWGIQKDAAEAARWYQKAAESGIPDAKTALARLRDTGADH